MSPFNDIRKLVESLPPVGVEAAKTVQASLEKARQGLQPLGRLGEIVNWMAQWQETDSPMIANPLVGVFIGTHAVTHYIMDADPVAGAKARFAEISKGKSGIRGIAGAESAIFKVYEMGLEYPAKDIRHEPSLSERECAAAIAYGMEVVVDEPDIIALGDAGFGSATAAAGIARALYGGAAEYWAGGEGEVAARRIDAVEQAAITHKVALEDPLEVLRCFGGRDIAGLFGAILAARHQKIPVLLDGYVVCAAAAVLHSLNPDAIAHCQAAHLSVEPAHGALLERIGKPALLDLGLGIGDGSGAAMTIGVARAACAGAREILKG